MSGYNILSEISRNPPEQYSGDGFMFTAYGCAVFERELEDGRYEYSAKNLSNGAGVILERRKPPITNVTVERLVRKLRDSSIAGLGKYEISGENPLPLSKLKTVLTALFREILPQYGYTIRKGQIELAEQLLDTIAGRRMLIAEASTGLGKTLVYILVGALIKRSGINQLWAGSFFPGMSAVEWQRMPVLISTSSIALQNAVIGSIKDISEILIENGITDSPLRVLLKKGRINYACEYNLRSYLPFEKDPDVQEALNLIIETGTFDLAEARGITPYAKSKIGVPVKCYYNCPYKKSCRYWNFRWITNENEFDFIVTNHNLLLMDAKLRAEGKGSALPPVQMYVADEAHQLVTAARSTYGAELSKDVIPDIKKSLLNLNFRPLHGVSRRQWRDVRDAVRILAKQMYFLNKMLFSQNDAGTECDGYLRNIHSTAEYLRKVLEDSHTLFVQRDEQLKYKLAGELLRLSETAEALSEGNGLLRWFEHDKKRKNNTTLCGLPKNLNERIYSDLWRRGVPAFLTSGTLSAGGDFSVFKRLAGISGLNRVTETVKPSPYNYKKNCLLYLSNKVPFPRQSQKSYINALTDEIERLIIAANGHTAVLFTSYSVMGRVYKKLKERDLPFPLFKLERSTSDTIVTFKESGNGVLFAAGALWEGIDIPGDALSMLIIVKLPFSTPDKVSEYEQSKYPNFRDYLESVLIPEMLVKLKQGFGRLIRTEFDTGCVAILDIRASIGEAYYEAVTGALPECGITDEIGDIGGFFLNVKPPEYFT